ncbi:hypothetical protein IAT38_003275 [Cryptococcus sp. DSM 104549]
MSESVPAPVELTSLPTDVSDASYADIPSGASLLLALRLATRPPNPPHWRGHRRLLSLLESGAHIAPISSLPLDPSIPHNINHPFTSSQITLLARAYKSRADEVKVKAFGLVLRAINDNPFSQ